MHLRIQYARNGPTTKQHLLPKYNQCLMSFKIPITKTPTTSTISPSTHLARLQTTDLTGYARHSFPVSMMSRIKGS